MPWQLKYLHKMYNFVSKLEADAEITVCLFNETKVLVMENDEENMASSYHKCSTAARQRVHSVQHEV